ncbi:MULTISPECIES: holo-ACP synthase [unclassified Vibrio]|uniref:Holo-[acyl-carrier-protein] synthase n=1 Tax=Vibrio sp. HB236076 TaxID=3232307 RepID=A0AB39HDM8_9VIBR|nr:holo-ACP synthase [Vibrio sp. HB161653]MDP5253958.1 holo-ACP synthase [Vibrio sp. HB161653]
MAIIGLGNDIVEIERIEKALGKLGVRFAERILHPDERARYVSSKTPHRYLAKRFAAKEAAAKALGTGIAKGVGFHDFIVDNDSAGKPFLTLVGQAHVLANQLGYRTTHLSLSDERHYALANVIIES